MITSYKRYFAGIPSSIHGGVRFKGWSRWLSRWSWRSRWCYGMGVSSTTMTQRNRSFFQPERLNIRPPQENKIVGTHDPNYQTLAGLNNADIFQNKGAAPPGGAGGWAGAGGGGPAAPNIRPPEQNKIVGTFDPNYQTLAGLNNEDVFKKDGGGGVPAGGGGGGGGFKPPAPPPPGQGKMAGTFDPNYQTLAGLNNDDVFKKKDGGGGGGGGFGGGGGGFGGGPAKPPQAPMKPAGGAKMAGTFDPNYQTLAGLNNEDVFKPKGGGGGFGGRY
ncbi:hypothetical protein Y032_0027g1540 [Ancylostoma ceylanicum]|nr:hypothetical protein Y032_0027g1540 [Ancylostoma ceylanicum]